MTTPAEYARRRRRLMRGLGANSVALIPAAEEQPQSRDVDWPFRQDSDFLYLTGFREPQAVAVLMPGRPQGEYVMFCRERDPQSERWLGPREGLEGVCENYGVDQAFPIQALHQILPQLLDGCGTVWYTLGKEPQLDEILHALCRISNRDPQCAPDTFRQLDSRVHEMRLFKSRSEIALMRRSAKITMQAHRRAMARAQPGCYEYELQAELLYEQKRHHMEFAYSDIVASGENACVLHYADTDRRIEEGDLVLVDSGGMYLDYASDVTRTWPVSGEFTQPQREIYELVLEAHNAAIKKCIVGNHCKAPHREATRVITRGLVSLGILKGRWQDLWKQNKFLPFFMHNTGHWMGMDVHDVGRYKSPGRPRALQPGMVTSTEPGLYFGPELKRVPKRFRGIGVRIEDDVVIGRSKPEVISANLPVDPDEVCRLIGTEVH